MSKMVGIQTNMGENEIDRMIVRRFTDLREKLPTLTWDKLILVGIVCYETYVENINELIQDADEIFDEMEDD